ncbi:FUSC family protein [Kitasatospora kifunensis]|uniref:Putative membrane protein YccC n=1 Tax=Kitasatospora kifunensis TaxID=58351 RepID=A0A7W7R9E2_KITKI|nr:FUSC family protein [Kitasatospora kifunensis]MBB4927650.1 putative membrane protein YccC [Kitasatospora kifunensis]
MSRPVRWLLRQEGGPDALRRAVWITLAGGTGFYVLTYGFHRPDMALYAIFGSLPLVLFAKVPGPARRRARTLLVMLPAGWLLVTAGTLLAVQHWAAALGLFVIGFLVSFLAIGGPRPAMLAAALQLYYVLPCFPPYEPRSLGFRLAGLTVGILLTIVVDLILWADPPPRSYRSILADALCAVADYCTATGQVLAGQGEPAAARVAGIAADRALEATRLSRVPVPERPTSAAPRDRGLDQARAATRHVCNQLDRMADSRPDDGHATACPCAAVLLADCAAALRRTAHDLRSGVPESASGDTLHAALRAFDAERTRQLATASSRRLRLEAITRSAAEGTLLAAEAAQIALGAAPDPRRQYPGGPFAYATQPALARWWGALRLQLTPHSVMLQNALRLATTLACARLVVGLLDLPHGFWVLLALLSLMRTSAADTRNAQLPALLGTIAGGALATLLLYLVGDVPAFYAAVTPVCLLVGFGVGAVLGPSWLQGAMTLCIVMLFVQILPPTLSLPLVRLLDVVVGGTIGVTASLLAWPRGAHGQLRSAVADFLSQTAEGCRSVTALLCLRAGPGADPLRTARHAMLLTQATYLQYRTESSPRHPADPSWELILLPGELVVGGGQLMLTRRGAPGPAPLPPQAAAQLTALADQVATEFQHAATRLRSGAPPQSSSPAPALRPSHPAVDGLSPDAVLLIADTTAWLTGVAQAANQARTQAANRAAAAG